MKQVNFEPEKYYHIYNRGNNREQIFLSEENYPYFLSLVTKHLLPICEIYSYCLIPNHFHFIIKIKERTHLPYDFDSSKLYQSFSNLFNAYTKAINKRVDRRGSLFEKHLKRIEITSSEYLRNLIIYVNTNSSHHEMEDYKTYKYSSYLSLISSKETHLKRKEAVELFDDFQNMKFIFEKKKAELDSIKELTFE